MFFNENPLYTESLIAYLQELVSFMNEYGFALYNIDISSDYNTSFALTDPKEFIERTKIVIPSTMKPNNRS